MGGGAFCQIRRVIPAKAGIQFLRDCRRHWIPAFAGMTLWVGKGGAMTSATLRPWRNLEMGPGLRRDDIEVAEDWHLAQHFAQQIFGQNLGVGGFFFGDADGGAGIAEQAV